MKHKKSKATDISQKVKMAVWERDDHRCVVCGNSYNVMPNSHYISRNNCGKGIEQNIITMCTELTENKCHRKYDFGSDEEREIIKEQVKQYLMSKYEGWNEDDLIYDKHKY